MMEKVKMKERSADERVKDFKEVPCGYTEDEAVKEASRCLGCKTAPCVTGCPAEVDIPGFIALVKQKKFSEAIAVIKKTNTLPAVCGRVCPQEDQCEKNCVLSKTGAPIDIGTLERFVADREAQESSKGVASQDIEVQPEGYKVAVIGAGPGGLTAAADLAKEGYRVTLFEGLHKPGGVLTYGIPEFRLPKDIVMREVEGIEKLGVEVKYNYVIGKIKTIEGLRKEGFKAFFICTGAGLPTFMGIKGENLPGVYSANEFLTRVNLMKAYHFPEYDTPVKVGRRVAVIGAGNVSMDSARCAVRLGAKEVHIVYRRTEQEMPARLDEIHHAREEGVKFRLLSTPVEIKGDEKGEISSMVCVQNVLGEPDSSGRRRPVALEGSEFEIMVDTVIIAIGNAPNPLLIDTIEGLELGKWGNIIADENGRTSVKDIFAGGDIVSGSATVIAAMGAGKKAARAIDDYIRDITCQ